MLRKKIFRWFGVLEDYKERVKEKMVGTHKILNQPKFFVTPARPSNFGDHIDHKVALDNWFDENRLHNEGETDIRKT